MSNEHEHQVLIETLKGARKVDFLKLVVEQREMLTKIKAMAGRKPDKVDTAYIEKHQAKMEDTFNLVASWIQATYPESPMNGYGWAHEILTDYEITVLVSKRVDTAAD